MTKQRSFKKHVIKNMLLKTCFQRFFFHLMAAPTNYHCLSIDSELFKTKMGEVRLPLSPLLVMFSLTFSFFALFLFLTFLSSFVSFHLNALHSGDGCLSINRIATTSSRGTWSTWVKSCGFWITAIYDQTLKNHGIVVEPLTLMQKWPPRLDFLPRNVDSPSAFFSAQPPT